MGDIIFLIKDKNGAYVPYINGHGIKLLPTETTRLIQDLATYTNISDDVIKLQNKEVEQHLFGG